MDDLSSFMLLLPQAISTLLSTSSILTRMPSLMALWLMMTQQTIQTQISKAVFFIIPLILTQVMSNLATVTIFIPLVSTACVKLGVDPRAAVVGVLTASCISIMTPMAAPCQIMIMGPGGYKLKDYFKCGTPLLIILTIVCIVMLPMMFPFY